MTVNGALLLRRDGLFCRGHRGSLQVCQGSHRLDDHGQLFFMSFKISSPPGLIQCQMYMTRVSFRGKVLIKKKKL